MLTLCSYALHAVAAEPVFRVVRTGVIYDGAPGYQPGIVRAPDGNLLVSFMSQGGIYTTQSFDNGLTWQKPQLVVEGAATSIGITKLRDGTILWPFFQELVKMPCCRVRRYRAYVYRSKDNGRTWDGDAPIGIQIREPIPYGHIVQLPDGELLMPVWGSYRLGDRWQVGTLESRDDGRTWGSYRRIAYDPQAGCRPDNGFNETSIAELPDHTLLAILREQRVGTRDDSPGAGPCDHYTEPADSLYRALSKDLGSTWSEPERLNLIGTSPALHVLPDGTLMLAFRNHPQHGTGTEHYGLAVRASKDQGKTWTDEVDLRDPKGLRYNAKLQPGYPDLTDLPNSDILVVFHSIEMRDGVPQGYIALNVLRRVK
ncbi:MAG: sialidase family protein [Terriglobia bacterium]